MNRTVTGIVTTLAFLFAHVAAAQGVLTVQTNRVDYAYGEPIEIRVTVANPSSETFTLRGSSSCQAFFRFNDFDAAYHTVCTTDEILFPFPPGAERTWRFVIEPAVLGLPRTDGPHTVVGYYPGTDLADSTIITAPQYRGGRLSVGVERGADPLEILAIQDTLNAVVIESQETGWGRAETWQISGVTVEEANTRYATDPKFRYLEPVRTVMSGEVLSQEAHPHLPARPSLTLSPHPCATTCTLNLDGMPSEPTRVVLYDLLGRAVHTYASQRFPAGPHTLLIHVHDLRPGLYLLRLESSTPVTSRLVVVSR